MFYVTFFVVIFAIVAAEFLDKPPKVARKHVVEHSHVKSAKSVSRHDVERKHVDASKEEAKVRGNIRHGGSVDAASTQLSKATQQKEVDNDDVGGEKEEDALNEITVPAAQLDSLFQEASIAMKLKHRKKGQRLSGGTFLPMSKTQDAIDQLASLGANVPSDGGKSDIELMMEDLGKTGKKELKEAGKYSKEKNKILSLTDHMNNAVEQMRKNTVRAVMSTKDEMNKELKVLALPTETQEERDEDEERSDEEKSSRRRRKSDDEEKSSRRRRKSDDDDE